MDCKVKAYKRITAFILAAGLALSVCGCHYSQDITTEESYEKAKLTSYAPVRDMESLYTYMPQQQVLYLTVGRTFQEGEPEHTWQEMNSHDLAWYESNDTKIYECDALVQFGNEDGPTSGSFGYGNKSNNATVRLCGEKASTRQQKSYRIRINPGSGNVNGMKTFFLNKNFGDPFRFTNKLCFDLINGIDELMSVRTGFVHLYVRDESVDRDALFVDYGLYTMVEPVNKRYLSNRSIDNSGELYKAEDFDFGRHEDVIMQPTDPGYDENRFEALLESKGSNDHTKLINLLNVLNDETTPIETVVNTYFDKDSLYCFMAFNILTANRATDTENFYLYSPTGTDRFYIIPWDFDSALRGDYELLKDPSYTPGWEQGIYLYTDSKLFGRMMKSPVCINELSERIAYLHENALSPINVTRRARELAVKVKPVLYAMPDKTFARVSAGEHDMLVEQLSAQMDNNYYAYYDSLETPWPFHILEPVSENGGIELRWEASSILEGDISYTVELSDSWDFNRKLIHETGLSATTCSAGALEPGQYFLRVSAQSSDGISQEAYEYYNTEKKTTVRGTLCFYVMEDGSIEESLFE